MQKTEKKEFLQLFQKMIDYGLLGIYRRQKMTEKSSESSFVPALARAGAIGAFLNFKFELEVDCVCDVHNLHSALIQYKAGRTILPLPLHLAKLLEEYML